MNENRQYIIISIVLIISFIFLFRLFQLQIFTNTYQLLSEKNIVQENTIFPSRGIIYDRNNNIIVENKPIYDLMIVPNEVNLIDTTFFLKLLNIDKDFFIEKFNKAKNYSYIKPSLFYKGISNKEFFLIQEEIGKFPGFYIAAKTVREYPNNISSHVMGYVGEIGLKELEKDTFNNYKTGDYIGISGIEKTYENQLKGRKGYIYKIYNVKGESIGSY